MRLPFPYRPEAEAVSESLASLRGALDWAAAARVAAPWVQAVRDNPPPFWAVDSLLKEYPISSAEGLALMRLAEALLRVPDAETAIALTADQLGRADFDGAADSTAMATSPRHGPRLRRDCDVEEVPAALSRSGTGGRSTRPHGQAGRENRGRRHPACGAAAGPPVRAGPDHRGRYERSRCGAAQAAESKLQLRHARRRRAHRCGCAAVPGQLPECHQKDS